MTLLSAVEQFTAHCTYEKRLSDKTLKAYHLDLKQFAAYTVAHEAIETIDKYVIRAFIRTLFERGLKERSVKRKVATLKALFSYLEHEELLQINPFHKMKIKIKEPKRLPRTIPMSEIGTIITHLYQIKNAFEKRDTFAYFSHIRDLLAIELLFATGMRVGELCSLRPADVNLSEGTVRIIGKGDKERIVHLCDPQILKLAEEYATLRPAFQIEDPLYLFTNRRSTRLSEQSVRFMIRKYSREAGIDRHITPHMFRHSLATQLLNNDVDIRYIQHILGHSSITTTQIYTEVTSTKQKMIMTDYHPRKEMAVGVDGG